MCIKSEAREGGVVHLGCQKICYYKEGSTCVNNQCLCLKEGPLFRACCDSCVGPLCLCPPTYDLCNTLCH